MSERPFMQLYVSDFLGDTLHLSTEHIGAYMLLLMAMWNAGGSLPNDDAKLARVCRLSLKKWRAVRHELMPFFDVSGDAVRHSRLTKELQKSEGKSQSRASAGAAGGRAKALKDKEAKLANASEMPWHLPDTRSQKEEIQHTPQPVAASAPSKTDRLIEAAGVRGNPSPQLAFAGALLDLEAQGYDFERDILPAVRSKPNPSVRSWSYYRPVVIDFVAARRSVPSKPAPAEIDWSGRLAMFATDGTWSGGWGPSPDEPGCRAPAHLLKAMTRAA